MKRLFNEFIKSLGEHKGYVLSHSTEVISEQFNKWLTTRRTRMQYTKDNFNKFMIAKWVKATIAEMNKKKD